ncbi:rifin [Plasmodium falciparum RAJ116]|uniref:Rifin n=1 Tax=Plasmodium falciparum RAJ116 TaxID=580058 RepID=A0A0L0CUP4_PLAFA|nr:rifin [Plasmodium falciparum RAJ116]
MSIYDNDPEMKSVMENYNRQTSQRFQEYNERIIKNRQKCKEECEKDIQKIILKDKIEKELAEKFVNLETNIDTNAIPTCVCEKSVADKVEKGCLKCGYGLGTVAPTVGLIGSVSVNVWKTTLIDVAIELAKEAGVAAGKAAGLKAGKDVVIKALEFIEVDKFFPGIFKNIRNITHYADVKNFVGAIVKEHAENCGGGITYGGVNKCNAFEIKLGLFEAETGKTYGAPARSEIPKIINKYVADATTVANAKTVKVTAAKTAEFEVAKKGVIEAASYDWYATVGYSVLAIIIIILIMIIIYLILRYRRKKKMKKKLQYIKLLEE